MGALFDDLGTACRDTHATAAGVSAHRRHARRKPRHGSLAWPGLGGEELRRLYLRGQRRLLPRCTIWQRHLLYPPDDLLPGVLGAAVLFSYAAL